MSQELPTISDEQVSDFLSRHQLPASFRDIIEQHYLPLASTLPRIRKGKRLLFLGVNGAQGTGKSTLADFLSMASQSMFQWNVAVLSIDDFYFTLEERGHLAKVVHPLLKTRGVPGTHDTSLLADHLQQLQRLGSGERVALPRFDKAADDRADKSRWPIVSGPIDLVILEGWCVGTLAHADIDLERPINTLEREEDPDGTWRTFINDQLKKFYAPIFTKLDFLVFISAPSFDAIRRWRMEQEDKLAKSLPEDSSGLMNEEQINRFIQFYERLTLQNLAALPEIADVVFQLDDTHSITS